MMRMKENIENNGVHNDYDNRPNYNYDYYMSK